jgi:hypothetical protein
MFAQAELHLFTAGANVKQHKLRKKSTAAVKGGFACPSAGEQDRLQIELISNPVG